MIIFADLIDNQGIHKNIIGVSIGVIRKLIVKGASYIGINQVVIDDHAAAMSVVTFNAATCVVIDDVVSNINACKRLPEDDAVSSVESENVIVHDHVLGG